VRVRDCVPLSSHDELKPVHAPQAVYVGEPHVAPPVVREHACDSTLSTDPHAPPEQIGSVRMRVCVPLSSHSSLKPPHAPHAPYEGEPQLTPSVPRVQPPLSTVMIGEHVADTHE
jgi:hypothetical protein